MKTISEQLSTPVGGEFDVIVCGGGPAGVCAAVAAGRAGASVLLVEKMNCLGGMWTSGFVNPLFDQENKGGLIREIVDRLSKKQAWGGFRHISFNYEYMKCILDDLCREAGVKVLFNTTFARTLDEDSTVKGIVCEHIGGRVTEHMRKSTSPKSVVFPHAGAIKSTFRRNHVEGSGPYYTDDAGYNSRKQYPIFVSSDEAEAIAGGLPVTTKDYNNYPFNLMTLTRDTVQLEDGNNAYTNVLACASTEFASAQFLDSAYGNHAVMAYMSSVMSRAVIPVSLDCKYFTDLEINSITAQDANQYMLVLTLVPAGIIFAAGIYIMVRRKYA